MSFANLVGGLVALIAALGIGAGIIRHLGMIPPRWRMAASLLAGIAVIDLVVMLSLFVGSETTGLKFIAGLAAIIGACALARYWRYLQAGILPELTNRADRWFFAVILAALAVNFLIASAPSTKIDELFYHMLLPKRVLEDHGLHLYRQPYESAIFPQMAFQLGLSAAHAVGVPEAGNFLSWGLGATLVLLIAGVTADLTRSGTAGWITGAIGAVGLYPAVWHVTSGPHALGDLAIAAACLLALLPEEHTVGLGSHTRLLLVGLISCIGASIKLSLLPLSIALAVIAASRAAPKVGWKRVTLIVVSIWGVFYLPGVVWTAIQSGSPLGLATAELFHSDFFGRETLTQMSDARQASQGWAPLIRWVAPSVSLGVLASFLVVAYMSLRGSRYFKIVTALVIGQSILIAWLLPHEFRFLGGLQYVMLMLGAWACWSSPFGNRLITNWWIVLFGLCLPWLAVQSYYAIPFVKVATGMVTRGAFLREYVAFDEDFRALDRILPSDAVLYAVNTRLPAYYAPRPVVLTLDDLRGRAPVYRFVVGSDPVAEKSALSCKETVYENKAAKSVVFRAPGRTPKRENLRVELCILTAPPTSRVQSARSQ